MIYIKVDGEWYITKYKRYNQLKMYETGQLTIAYDSELDEIIANEVWNPKTGYTEGVTYEQVKLELFLQGEKLHEWSMQLHQYGHNLTSERMNLNL